MRGIRARISATTTSKPSKVIGILTACVVALVVAFPAPAQAALGTQAQWRDFPELRQGLYTNSNLVKLWQLIVQSDVDTGRTCAQFADGQFGPNTYTRTRNWQGTFSIGVDGQVGPQTWGTAQGHLQHDHTNFTDLTQNGTGDKVWGVYYYYIGKRSNFYIAWGWTDHYRNGQWTYTTYDAWEFQACGQPYWITVSW